MYDKKLLCKTSAKKEMTVPLRTNTTDTLQEHTGL